MEEVIKKIIQIEEEAADMEKSANEKIQQKKIEQEKALEHLRQNLKRKAADKVKTLHEWGMKETDEEIAKQKIVLDKRLAALDEIEKEKAGVWLNTLFAEITKE